MRCVIFVWVHILAALVPFSTLQPDNQSPNLNFPGWPQELDGQVLTRMPMTEKERGYNRNFPGKIARFTDGSREIIMRFVERPSRNVHPSADCLRGSGFELETQPIRRDQGANLWGCVLARRDGQTYRVCERIYDSEAKSGWYDVSSWYWAARLGQTQGPWWVVTVAERI